MDAWLSFTRPRYEALRRDTSVLTDAVAMLRDVRTRIDGRPLRSTLVTGNFFQYSVSTRCSDAHCFRLTMFRLPADR